MFYGPKADGNFVPSPSTIIISISSPQTRLCAQRLSSRWGLAEIFCIIVSDHFSGDCDYTSAICLWCPMLAAQGHLIVSPFSQERSSLLGNGKLR